ncbi:MAG: protein-glutamate O-methyltransferase CheR, partial [Nitrospirae bacterium]|nr:protein-glutamate O-methyltransferase CheR [Nitrospirota bacterium]
MDLNPFKDLIRERSGLDFDEARIATLENGIRTRMSEKGIELHAKYLNYLLHNQDEFNHLLNLLTINETYFFREPHHLNLLTEKLIPEILARRKEGARIKILSAGCSTGEEPYSLLISLMERYGTGIINFVSVTGFDIDSNVIRKAREGVFTTYSFRDVSQQFMEKYFEPAGNNRHKIKDFVREGVKFRKLNLLDDDFPDELKGVDVIFYRNVSIYFNPETQRNIFKKLSDLINEKGYLFVGSTETISHNTDVLSLIEIDGVFLFYKNTEKRELHSQSNIQKMKNTCPEGFRDTKGNENPPSPPFAKGGDSGGGFAKGGDSPLWK